MGFTWLVDDGLTRRSERIVPKIVHADYIHVNVQSIRRADRLRGISFRHNPST